MIQTILRRLLCCLALLAMTPAGAADTFKVNRSAVYADEAVGDPEIRSGCDWNTVVVNALVHQARGTVVVTDEDLSKASGKILKLIITKAHGAIGLGGGSWARINTEVWENGKLIRSYVFSSHSASLIHGACGVLEKVGKQMGKNMAKQLRKGVSPAVGATASPEDDKIPDDGTDIETADPEPANPSTPQPAPTAP